MDAIELIRRQASTRTATYRCSSCGLLQPHRDELPTGGVRCARCDARIGPVDRVEYGAPQARLFSTTVDVLVLIVPYLVYAFVLEMLVSYLPRDVNGDLTPRTVVVLSAIGGVTLFLYLWAHEATGWSFGRAAAGLRVVRAADGNPPGIVVGLLRLLGKALTIASLGLGYAWMFFDPQRRTLHDWIAGTRVIER